MIDNYNFNKVSPRLAKRHYGSSIRASISPAKRLAVTLRFLATGNSQVKNNGSCRLKDTWCHNYDFFFVGIVYSSYIIQY